MKILLINLSLRPESFQCIFPIGIGYIATALKEAGLDFDLLDMDVHKFNDQEPLKKMLRKGKYDIVAFGCIVTGYHIVKEIAQTVRDLNGNAIIICGNSVASSIAKTLLTKTEVDIAVLGEGDVTIVDLLGKLDDWRQIKGIAYKDYDTNSVVWTAPREPIENLDDLPILRWDLFEMDKYITKNRNSISEPRPIGYSNLMAMPINSARGCMFRCTFCYQVFRNNKYRYRSTKSISKELDYLKKQYDINYITFYDDLTIFNKRRAEDFAEMMTGRKIHWTACCRAGLFTREDKELLKRLKKSNCVSLGYSLESANEKILEAMKKKISLEAFREQKKALDEAGIATITSLVVGYPQETEESIAETFNFCLENGIYPSTGYLLPQPGTPMYDYAVEHRFITEEEPYLLSMGDRQDLRLNMTAIPSKRLENLVEGHLGRIRDHLKLPLRDDQLLKTGVVRGR